MKKLTSILAGALLFFMSGCATLTPKNISKPNKIVNYIFSEKETKIPYEEIKIRGGIVASSLKNNYPKGLVIYIKGNTPEGDRYVALNLKDDSKTLVSTFYKFPDSKINEKLSKFYLFHKNDRKVLFNIGAKEVLEKSDYQSRIMINDFNNNGPRKSEPEDFITYRIMDGKENILRGGKLTREGKLVKNANPDELLLVSGLRLRDYLKIITSN
jgi:hypothetical protein